MRIYKDKRGFLALVGLLLTLVIICYLFSLTVNTYFKKPIPELKTERLLYKQGIASPNYQSIISSSIRPKIKDINKQLSNRGMQLENIGNE